MTSKVAEEQFAITHMVRNEEIDDEELGLQIQPFNHGDPHPIVSWFTGFLYFVLYFDP
jgi:hypothetical protein